MRYMLYAGLALELGLVVLGYPFLTLWMGRKYADAGYPALLILALSVAFSAINMVSARTLEGLGHVRALACVTVVEAIATIGLGVPLAYRFGIQGVAAALTFTVALATIASFVLVCRFLKLNPLHLFFRTCFFPSLAGALAATVWLVLQKWLPIEHWSTFLARGMRRARRRSFW